MLMSFLARPHLQAKEVYVTGTFDDWGKTEKLHKVGGTFEKEVHLPDASVKVLYKVRQEHTSRVLVVNRKLCPESARSMMDSSVSSTHC
jgi:Glycogen recognition site of AMP-activated protein kinase